MRLVTIPFSHYNERARWALDRFGFAYDERRFLPLFHFAGVLWSAGLGGRADTTSSPMSTPVLVEPGQPTLRDSGAIVRLADERAANTEATLYPAEHREAIEAIEQLAHDKVGPHTRRIAYFYLLGTPAAMRQLVRENVGSVQNFVYRLAAPMIALALRRVLKIDEAQTQRSIEKLDARIEELSQQLGSRRYIVGDRFSAADLTLASLLSPVIVPEPYGAKYPDETLMPEEFRTLVYRWRDTPIGQYVLRIFAEERSVVV